MVFTGWHRSRGTHENQVNARRCVAASLLTLGLAPAAFAAGTGNTVNGCTAKWYNTAFSANCTRTTQSGVYQNYGNCSAQQDFWAPRTSVSKGATVTGVSRGECRFSAKGAKIAKVG